MKKSDLNSSMLFKMRDQELSVLLDVVNDKVFYNKMHVLNGESRGIISLDDYNEGLMVKIVNDDNELDRLYDIIATKQYGSTIQALHSLLNNQGPKEWDWLEEVKPKETHAVNNFTSGYVILM